MSELENLYARKGELVTSIEIASAELRAIDQRILPLLAPPPPQNGKRHERFNTLPTVLHEATKIPLEP